MNERPSWEQTPVAALKGAGAATAAKLEKLGIRSVGDLLFHLPLRYEDRTRVTPIGALQPGSSALAQGRVELTELVPKGRRSLVCRIGDGTGHLYLRFFHFTQRQREQLARGALLACFGEARNGFYGLEMVHPEYHFVDALTMEPAEGGLTAVYPLTEGVRQQTLRRLTAQAVNLLKAHELSDWLPESIRRERRWPGLSEALITLHCPPSGTSDAAQALTPALSLGKREPEGGFQEALAGPLRGGFQEAIERARQRLAFEELLAHHLSLTQLRGRIKRQPAPVLEAKPGVLDQFAAALPFAMTAAQRRVIGELGEDLAAGSPMLRLVQGDVGAGKTVVAACAALMALSGGWQVALMAPTELLAEQHLRSFSAWLEPLGVRLVG
ncbi:DEAD/DEAH box helicase, partial [Methylogaea oryzae]